MKSPLLLTALGGLALLLVNCTKPPGEIAPETPPAAAAGLVTLTEKNLALVKIGTAPAQVGALALTLSAPGRVTADENKTAKVASTFPGRLVRLAVDLSDPVRRGDLLATIEAPELLGKQLELKAPLDGVVVERKSAVGEQVDANTTLLTISDPTSIWVIAEIQERDLGAIKVGQEARFRVVAYPEETFTGAIVRLGHEVETASRTLEARIAVANLDGRLRPGMFADVEITTEVSRQALLIPDGAVQTDAGDQIVFVALNDRQFQRRAVQTGHVESGQIEVLAGLKSGERVVTEGSFILKSELSKSELGEE